MKKTIFVVFSLLALLSVSFADELNTTGKMFERATTESGLEILSSWQVIAIGALIISVILVALAYIIAMGFEMPEVKAWAGTEVTQIISTGIIIVLLIGTITFLDLVTSWMINESGIMSCGLGENCLQEVSVAYLNESIGAAESGAKDCLKNAMQAGAWMGRGIGIYATTIILGQLGLQTTLGAHYALDLDRYTIIYEYYTNLLASLYAQRFFLEQFAFKIGPILLALGIVGRSFFITRKTGGLLIAIAAGIMFFLPMMYVFDWVTFDMVISGDNAVQGDLSLCPSECRNSAPIAYYPGGTVQDQAELYEFFEEEQRDEVFELLNGDTESLSNGSVVFNSCNYDSDPDDGVGCPPVCRELPYPASVSECADVDNQTFCAELDDRCKVIRLVPDATENPEYDLCPEECKIVPPLKGDCDTDRCLESRPDCRVAKRSDLDWRPSISGEIEGHERCNDYAKDCPENLDAFESCTWIIPDSGTCNEICGGCPSYCRISGADTTHLPEDCFEEDSDELLSACVECHPTCMIEISALQALDDSITDGSCSGCYLERRLLGGTTLPAEYIEDDCSPDACPVEYRLQIPRTACEQCLEVSDSFLYEPPINTDCGDLCKPSAKVPTKSASDFGKSGSDDLVGFSEIQNISRLMIPGYFLPLFNIAATLIFIISLSAMLGGDIEIPGISKVF